MNSPDDLLPPDNDLDASLHRLRARLEADAQSADLLDVAYRTLDTPIGTLLVAATSVGVVRVALPTYSEEAVLTDLATRVSPRILRSSAPLDHVSHQIDEYFTRRRNDFALDVDFSLVTGFRRTVLEELRHVPYGHTASYGELAASAGNPRAVRATGTACAQNPVPIVVPCHRITRSDGTLGNYGGGQAMKRTLLEMEGAIHPDLLSKR